ncbi:MAG: ATP-binding protein, partial [Planctomycetes bacterium]|nr:ATP-binding protein [Planctomycetota bacterium]
MAQSKKIKDRLQFRLHPRVFAALGADLITNDVVAIIELVKNSYDAYATRVDVRFCKDEEKGSYIEIEDNGCGMDYATIENVWCMVATPYRVQNPVSQKGKHTRRTSGEKGLGRLSAARLGNRLEMITKASMGPCWDVIVNWSNLSSHENVESCFVDIHQVDNDIPFAKTGTLLRIFDLKTEWDEDKISELRDNLSRLISPFASTDDFKIFLKTHILQGGLEELEISAPEFLSKPKYAIRGHVDKDGTVRCKYEFSPIPPGKKEPRTSSLTLTWDQIVKTNEDLGRYKNLEPECGSFDFEIRAWDIASGDTEEIAKFFDETKSHIRQAIKTHKGISVYRDGILVLPKSEDSRDWLGLDLRRISKVGTRLSTSQIVGYVSITAENNPYIKDKSDREGLMASNATVAFQGILKAIVYLLENERDKDRIKLTDEESLTDLFEDLTAEDMLAEMVAIAEEGAPTADAIPLLQDFNKKLNTVRNAIKKRFVYYSRLATVGTIAQMLVHEVRNRTTIFGNVVRYIAKNTDENSDPNLLAKIERAENAIASLEQLADTFAPLASRSFRRRKRDSILEDRVGSCLTFVKKEIEDMDITVGVPKTSTRVAIDPGELDAII